MTPTNRYMRILLLFDLPMVNENEKTQYTRFRNHILRLGYKMVQYSVYMKTIIDKSKFDLEFKKVSKYLPNNGNIRLILITEKQYQDMKILMGKKNYDEIYNDTSRYIKV